MKQIVGNIQRMKQNVRPTRVFKMAINSLQKVWVKGPRIQNPTVLQVTRQKEQVHQQRAAPWTSLRK